MDNLNSAICYIVPHNKPLANVMKTAGQENLVKAMKVFKLTHLDSLCAS